MLLPARTISESAAAEQAHVSAAMSANAEQGTANGKREALLSATNARQATTLLQRGHRQSVKRLAPFALKRQRVQARSVKPAHGATSRHVAATRQLTNVANERQQTTLALAAGAQPSCTNEQAANYGSWQDGNATPFSHAL